MRSPFEVKMTAASVALRWAVKCEVVVQKHNVRRRFRHHTDVDEGSPVADKIKGNFAYKQQHYSPCSLVSLYVDVNQFVILQLVQELAEKHVVNVGLVEGLR
jgi:hypothetical protein